jgi:CDGSH-type Zn-finger protein/ferredoxin
MTIETTEGNAIAITYDGKRCIHARRCVMGEPAVFRANVEGPWIDANGATAEEIKHVALNCPSGAITIRRKDGGTEEHAPKANLIIVRENGPLAVHADLTIEGHGQMFRATLCRCGLSRNKPFCDNSHIEGGFHTSGEPASTESNLAITDLTGPVTITPTPNGPLKVIGNLEIESGTGRSVTRVDKAWLCRCGQSSKKPYCDGTHKTAGFEAP